MIRALSLIMIFSDIITASDNLNSNQETRIITAMGTKYPMVFSVKVFNKQGDPIANYLSNPDLCTEDINGKITTISIPNAATLYAQFAEEYSQSLQVNNKKRSASETTHTFVEEFFCKKSK